jgi:hypothetical protein
MTRQQMHPSPENLVEGKGLRFEMLHPGGLLWGENRVRSGKATAETY